MFLSCVLRHSILAVCKLEVTVMVCTCELVGTGCQAATMRQTLLNSECCLALKVKNRNSEENSGEIGLSDAEIRQLEAKFFESSQDFNPPPCGLTLPRLVQKLEELQWDVYRKYLPGLERQASCMW